MSDSTRQSEAQRLKQVAEWYRSDDDFYGRLVYYNYLTYRSFFTGSSLLELGCADGHMTQFLLPHFRRVVAVDASEKYCAEVRKRFPDDGLEVVCSLFENLTLDERFGTVVLSHVLEHVEDPIAILRIAKDFLAPDGHLLITVPNADSLHREAGVLMGGLSHSNALNDRDRRLGHRRVYRWDELQNHVAEAGLSVEHRGGIFLKPLSNAQIDASWTVDMMNAYYELGKRYPHMASEIFVVAKRSA